ncbi:hypothetical protein ACIFQM_23675 [Paenibacillus sp. NRS-1782]|uniref:hypothetical protein n=1 Tax=unclassified Paenibacillus TaxID=185978 RepID=UPI003D2DE58B
MKFIPLEELENIIDVRIMNDHVLALNAEGTVLSADRIENGGNFAPFQTLSSIEDVTKLNSYYEERPQYEERWIFLKKDGTVWTWPKVF